MQITIDRALGWLLCIQVTVMLVVIIWHYYAHGAVTKANLEIVKRSNEIQETQQNNMIRNQSLITSWEALLNKQTSLTDRAEKLLTRLEKDSR